MRPRPAVPAAIAVSPPGTVTVTWRDGRVDAHRARDLRLRCPCAHCVHETTGTPLLDPTTVPADLAAIDSRPVGNYATQFLWSDGHRTGLYTHEVLRGLGTAAP
jgi:ATP-binding protein involved in chromosome partitioning